ncbi:MAG: TRAP transporter TatT component family protein [bacterium]
MRHKYIALLVVLLIQPACGMKKMTTRVIGNISTSGIVAIEGEQDVEFAEEAMPALIKTLEVLRHGDTRDPRTLVLLSKAYGTYTFGFLEERLIALPEKDPQRAAAAARADLFYDRGKNFGVAALISDSGMRKAFDKPFPEFKRAVDGLGKKHVPALFWTAFNWANWINLHRDDPSAVVDIPRIKAMAERVIELDPGFYYGSAHALVGIIAASRPKALGGEPELAEKEFREAMSTEPKYLMTPVLYALFYARQMNDAPLFRKTLEGVESADAAALPAERLANELAKRRAKLLLEKEKALF